MLRGGSPARRTALANYFEQQGLLATVKQDPGTAQETASNTVNLVVNRHVVTPPACPNWSNFDGNENRNTPGSNYGCAVDASLGYMVANPRDLIQGQTMDPAYSNPMIRTLRNYEAGKAIPPKSQRTGG